MASGTTLTSLQSAAERHHPAAIAFLRQLVAVNSFSANPCGVQTVAEITARQFESLGLKAEYCPCSEPASGPHLFLHSPTVSGPPVLLVTHSDTVFPESEETQNHFEWDDRPGEGRIYGPGTVDNKGGTAAIWLLLQVLKDCQPELFAKTPWLVAANAVEEVTSDHFGIETSSRCPDGARAVLVFEGGPKDAAGWHVVTSRKGRSTWRLAVEGRAAHAGSRHEDGINAIEALAEVLPRVRIPHAPADGRSVNLALCSGGVVLNRVPHHAEAEWEVRALTVDSLAEADEYFTSLSGIGSNGARLSTTRTGHTPPWSGGSQNQALLDQWLGAARECGVTLLPQARGGLSDANYLWHLGPTLDGLGPSGGNAHCSERSADGSKLPEFVEPSTFVPKTVLNALALIGALEC